MEARRKGKGMSMLFDFMKAQRSNEREAVRSLGDNIGYGNMMDLAQECWRDVLASDNLAGGEFAIGPCVSMTVPCGCDSAKDCDWCCGSRWLTKHVKRMKDG